MEEEVLQYEKTFISLLLKEGGNSSALKESAEKKGSWKRKRSKNY